MEENRSRTNLVDFEKARLDVAVKKGYRNWASEFGEAFGLETRLCHLSLNSVATLAQGRENSAFCLYDLIMNLLDLGSGFEFHELSSRQKMEVVDRYLFLLDRIRFEYMKRLGWLESYPGEEITLVEFVVRFEEWAPSLQAKPPLLSRKHPAYDRFCKMEAFEREQLIRELIPLALRKIQDSSTTL